MSAGVCIMNQNSIALAADSAVTVGGGIAIHNSVNKLFSLSRKEPLGALIYANANLMDTPVEIMLKQYRKHLDGSGIYCDSLEEYLYDFMDFLKKQKDLFRFEINERSFVLNIVTNLLDGLDGDIKRLYSEKVNKKAEELNDEEYKELYKEVVGITKNFVDRHSDLPEFNQRDYVQIKYKVDIEQYIKRRYNVFTKEDVEILVDASLNIISKDFWREGYVGLSIAGYGVKEIYPSMVHVHIAGFLNGQIKYKIIENGKVDENEKKFIYPFAQVDVMETFLYGMNNRFLHYIEGMIPVTLGKDIDSLSDELFADNKKDEVKKELEVCTAHIVNEIINEAQGKYFHPINNSVASLPMDELAMLAESMINLTSLRRQVAIDANSRTVGGPIDVAIISKGDGFIWVKRKHYFDGKLNPQYFHANFGGEK